MDQNSNIKVLNDVLASPADHISSYANDLQRLAFENPQSGVLHALVARSGLPKNGASAYFDSRALYKIINLYDNLAPVTDQQIILPGSNTKALEDALVSPWEYQEGLLPAPSGLMNERETEEDIALVSESDDHRHHHNIQQDISSSTEHLTSSEETAAETLVDQYNWPPEHTEETLGATLDTPIAEHIPEAAHAAEQVAAEHEVPVVEHVPDAVHAAEHIAAEPELPVVAEVPVAEQISAVAELPVVHEEPTTAELLHHEHIQAEEPALALPPEAAVPVAESSEETTAPEIEHLFAPVQHEATQAWAQEVHPTEPVVPVEEPLAIHEEPILELAAAPETPLLEPHVEPVAATVEPPEPEKTPVEPPVFEPVIQDYFHYREPVITPVHEETPAAPADAIAEEPAFTPYHEVEPAIPAQEFEPVQEEYSPVEPEAAHPVEPQQEKVSALAFEPFQEHHAPETETPAPKAEEEHKMDWETWGFAPAEEQPPVHHPVDTEPLPVTEEVVGELPAQPNIPEVFIPEEEEATKDVYDGPDQLEYEWVVTPQDQSFEMDERLLDHLAAEYFTFDKTPYVEDLPVAAPSPAPVADVVTAEAPAYTAPEYHEEPVHETETIIPDVIAPPSFIPHEVELAPEYITEPAPTSVTETVFEPAIIEPVAELKNPPAIKLDISRYNDEKMPYSFMWWLDKTRQEHSSLYQPFAKKPVPDQAPEAAEPAPELLREVKDPLTQQYYENIFHITSIEDVSKQEPKQNVQFNMNKKEDIIIRRFIKEEPHISAPMNEKLDNENKARKSSEDSDEIVTETLARIYIDQMLYPKAIATYKKLMLKIPEKSRYFASQIKNLENKTN